MTVLEMMSTNLQKIVAWSATAWESSSQKLMETVYQA